MLELAAAIRTLTDLLDNEATGMSLEPLYEKVPDCLKGYVELVYDLSNNPSIRFIEGLLYKSRYYRTSSQSISLSEVNHDDRPFALSTPQLGGNGRVYLKIPFNSPALDELFKMRTTACLRRCCNCATRSKRSSFPEITEADWLIRH